MLKKTFIYPYEIEYYRIYNETFVYSTDWNGFIKSIPKVRFVKSNEKNETKLKASLFKKKCEKSRIKYQPQEVFLYSLDTLTRAIPKNYQQIPIGNLPVNYKKILNNGLTSIQEEIKTKMESKDLNKSQKSFLESLLETVEAIEIMRKRQLIYLKKLADKYPQNNNVKSLVEIFSHVPIHPARTFKEALQSLLFINSLIWMDDHPLVGLGRLDQTLYPFLRDDLENGRIKIDEAYNLIKEFLKTLNKYYEYKSNTLLGDTGQIIILGGKNRDGTESTNQLTFMFMDALRELKLPDPKLILRIHENTPEKLWEKAVQCLEEGLGYPLFSNDNVIIKSLIEFGYTEDDSYNYGTSACWEPLIPGKSLDQNNLANINLLEPLKRTLENINKKNVNPSTFKDFLELYERFLEDYVTETVKKVDNLRFEPSPLLSLLMDDCITNAQDISHGGARYNNFGLLTVAMGNTVNALLNIKRLVFEDKKIKITEIPQTTGDNFESNETLALKLQNKGLKFGMDEDIVIELTNELISIVQQKLEDFKNPYGGRYKFGLSSPGFITESQEYPASFDGRKAKEPFGVHISPLSYTSDLSYTEITNFASHLNYRKAFNGDVVDIMMEKSFLKNNEEDFVNFLKVSFKKGVMQLQVNVLNPETLIKARKNPELYPNLIVRVWGFSAYFKDLPDEYKDLIIKRALQYESANHQCAAI